MPERFIYKYQIEPSKIDRETKTISFEVPSDSNFLSIKIVNEKAYIYILCNNSYTLTKRTFKIVTTGEKFELTENHMYRGTFTITRGLNTDLVFHVFEE